ncbi:DUF559 domain-containing protein [Acidaminococcus sp. AM05-11]|jgi:very-short-patch-repair endonuclease|nr:DUF559 domain-containing protein [Acidaminococcus sp. AM05-11]
MMNESNPYVKHQKLQQKAKELRKNMSRAEKRLWFAFLRHHSVKWRRFKVFDDYIVTFYCVKAQLVINVIDGQEADEETLAYIQARTEFLKQWGLEEVRFSEKDVLQYFDTICYEIDNKVQSRIQENPARRSQYHADYCIYSTIPWP